MALSINSFRLEFSIRHRCLFAAVPGIGQCSYDRAEGFIFDRWAVVIAAHPGHRD